MSRATARTITTGLDENNAERPTIDMKDAIISINNAEPKHKIIKGTEGMNTFKQNNDIFIDNKYTKWYFNIINSEITKIHEYSEKHHIIPKSLGGTEHSSNIAKISGKAHFICHHLLTKMLNGKEKQKMWLAFKALLMGNNKQKSRYNKINPKLFSELRRQVSILMSEKMKNRIFSDETKYKMSQSQIKLFQTRGFGTSKGVIRSEEFKQKISQSKQGQQSWLGLTHSKETKQKLSEIAKNRNPEHNLKISESLKGNVPWNKGKLMSEEQKLKLSFPKTEEHKQALRKPKIKEICPHCLKLVAKNNQFHFNKCKKAFTTL